MTRTGFLALLMAASLAACTQTTPEQQIIDDGAAALGGSDQIRAVSTLVLEGEGTRYNLGQDVMPEASGETFSVTGYRRAIDVAGGRARTELTFAPNFTYFRGPGAIDQVTGIDGDVGYNVAGNGNVTRVNQAAAGERRAELFRTPLTALRAALDPMASVTNARTEGSESVVDVVTADGDAFTLAVDSTTHLPSRVVSMGNNTNLGDVAIATNFAGYQEVDGLQLPTILTTMVDDFTTEEIRVASQTVDGAAGDLAAPADAASSPAVTAAPPASVNVDELADGVWYLDGQSHHSVVVEFSDHLMLIEAPQNDTRALAVIARARELRPDKPLTQLVNTHHHFDHSGGVRAAISEGLTVITHEGNVDFFERMAARPHTIQPDALGMNPMPATIEGVADMRVISDDTRTVNLYSVSNAHTETMLMVYLPQARILVEADVYNPGPAWPFSAEFLESVQARNLDIDRIAPLHASVTPYTQFVEDATAAAAN
jgi:glyoxylase-like metal-dependent hydrolase (beta-lactamase superfamily II)